MNPELSEALQLYLGFGTASWPQADRNGLAQRFGQRSSHINDQIAAILTEAERFRPDWSEHDLAAATRLAEDHMRKRHSELTDEAIRAIGWAWSYWNK